ncbi:Major facilitator sugar transporter-like [Trinorchestia longiramus]|nr:Major facilitator sugar transporter-like [Trinorchestia longiramus]
MMVSSMRRSWDVSIGDELSLSAQAETRYRKRAADHSTTVAAHSTTVAEEISVISSCDQWNALIYEGIHIIARRLQPTYVGRFESVCKPEEEENAPKSMSKMERDKLMYKRDSPSALDSRQHSDEDRRHSDEDRHHNKEDNLRATTKRKAFKNLKHESQEPLDFDDLLPHVGEFGKYQKLLVFLVCLPACIPCGIHAFSQLFMAPVPEHWCKVGGPELRTAAASILSNQQSPGDENWQVGDDVTVAELLSGVSEGPPADIRTTHAAVGHLDNVPSGVTPTAYVRSAQKKFSVNELEKNSAVNGNPYANTVSEPFSLNESPATDLVTLSPNLTHRIPEPNKRRHYHQQKHSKKHYKSFTIPTSLIRVVTGYRTNKKNTPLGAEYSLRGSQNYNHKPAPYFSKSSDDPLLRKRVERSVSTNTQTLGGNIIRRGKYSLVEEDGHASHVHHIHDKQLLDIFATIAVIEERLEQNFLLLDDEKLHGVGRTETPQPTEAMDDLSTTTVKQSQEKDVLNNDISLQTSEPYDHVEYTIPILTPKLNTGSFNKKFRGTRHRKFTFLPVDYKQKEYTNEKDSSEFMKWKPRSMEKEPARLSETSFIVGNSGLSETVGGSKSEHEKFDKNRTAGIQMEQEEFNQVSVYSKQNISRLVESVDERNRTKESELQKEDFDLLVEKFIRDIYIPKEATGKHSCCARYDVTPELDVHNLGLMSSNTSVDWTHTHCDQGWVYDTSSVKSSIVIDFDLVCARAIFPTIGLAVLNVGGIIGVYFFGTLSDKFGRRASFLLCLGIQQVAALVTAAAPSYSTWLTCRFFVGLTIPAIYQIPFIISMELVGPNYRSFVTVLTCLSYVSGMMILAGVAFLVRDWQLLCVVTSLPFFTYIIYWWFLPESPRWLLGRGRLHEASKILQSMARVNGAELPESFQQSLASQMLAQQAASRNSNSDSEKILDPDDEAGFCALWQTTNMRLKTILIILVWFANETVYVGLSYYGPVMGENEYLAFFLSCLVEVPSYFVCWVVMDRWGRRWILGVGMILGGLCSVVTVLTPPESTVVAQSFYLAAKFSEAAAFLIIYPFSAELFPTSVRGVGIGFAAYVGGLGLIVIPFINYLGSEMLSLPLVIMGVLSVVGGIAAFRLPETLHQPLPNTIKEGEQFGKNFSWANCWSCKPKDGEPESDEDTGQPHESKKYRDEIIDLTTLNRLSIDEGRPLRRRRNDVSLLADESDYVTENEYSADEDDSSDSDYCAGERVRYERGKRKTGRPRNHHSRHGIQFSDDESEFRSRSEFSFSVNAEGSRNVDLSTLNEVTREPTRVIRSESGPENYYGTQPATSAEGLRAGHENSPKLKRGSTKRGKLVKQTSIVPIITDSSGAMKMTFWM